MNRQVTSRNHPTSHSQLTATGIRRQDLKLNCGVAILKKNRSIRIKALANTIAHFLQMSSMPAEQTKNVVSFELSYLANEWDLIHVLTSFCRPIKSALTE